MSSRIVHVRKKGRITLPAILRSSNNIKEGDMFTLIDMGDGSFLLTPGLSEVDRLGKEIEIKFKDAGISPEDALDDMLNSLDEIRYFPDIPSNS